jgi:hypothetical protein
MILEPLAADTVIGDVEARTPTDPKSGSKGLLDEYLGISLLRADYCFLL